jgi:uncharacterized linocin/CFP29 family protein
MSTEILVPGKAPAGSIGARLLAANFAAESLRTADVLRYNEWEMFDNEVIQIARQRLVVAGDLISRGLTMPLPDALGVPMLHWQTGSDMNPAQVDMSGITPGQNDRQEFANAYLPIPIVHKDFQINIRALHASRRGGNPLDVSQAGLAARIVSEGIDNIIVNGAAIVHGGGTVYGYTTHPQRITGSLTASWATATGDQILTDTLAMVAALKAKRFFGPYGVYMSSDFEVGLERDFKTNVMGTIAQRLLMIGNPPNVLGATGIQFIKVVDQLAAGQVVVVQLTKDVVQLVDGFAPTTVQWEEMGGMIELFKVMAIMVPRFSVQQNGWLGVAHYSTP